MPVPLKLCNRNPRSPNLNLHYLSINLLLLLTIHLHFPHSPFPPPSFFLPFSTSSALPSSFSSSSLSPFVVPLDLFCPRRCGNPNCKGIRKALEFDLRLQTEDSLKPNKATATAKVIEKLPWKGGTESNPDYECLRAELRKMTSPNGRDDLLFRAKCGCHVAKLIGWGPKKGRKHKK